MSLNKSALHAHIIGLLTREWEKLTASAQATFDTATDPEHAARSKYETFSLETSYLARGQAQRVSELKETLEVLRGMSPSTAAADASIRSGSLVRLRESDSSSRLLYLVPAGGGETINWEGYEIELITPQSPLGRSLRGLRQGETVSLTLGGQSVHQRIDAVD